ncbi:MAG TPA: hypothetical protein VJM08_15090 [Anaerolineales bacterium]|nr:hypothetical protein [Anaerolineales bacterium]
MTENTRSGFESYLVILIDADTARFFAVRLGMVEEIGDAKNYAPPATGDIAEKTGQQHDTYLHQHVKSVIARAEVLWREQGFDWLMIGGTEEALSELYDGLPRALHERLAVGLQLSPQADTAKIIESVLSVEREHKQRIEKQRVEEQETPEQQVEEAERARKLEEKMDEALEESFPASDPPYWMPL